MLTTVKQVSPEQFCHGDRRSAQGVDPPSGGGPNLAEIWLGSRRSLCLARHVQCPLFLSLLDATAPLGVDALAHPWLDKLLYVFPLLSLISPTLARVREQRAGLVPYLDTVAIQTLGGRNNSTAGG